MTDPAQWIGLGLVVAVGLWMLWQWHVANEEAERPAIEEDWRTGRYVRPVEPDPERRLTLLHERRKLLKAELIWLERHQMSKKHAELMGELAYVTEEIERLEAQ